MSKKILIIGGGAIGLFSAYYLQKAGYEVIIADKGDLSDNCSYGNAGLIVPSHVIPLASPGMVSRAFKQMFNASAPIAFRLPPSVDFLKWSYRFVRSSNDKHVQRSTSILKELSSFSKILYKEIIDRQELSIQIEEKGLLIVYRSERVEMEEIEAAKIANGVGIVTRILSREEILDLEPTLTNNISGGVYYPGDCHLVPSQLMKNLISWLENSGVTVVRNAVVTAFRRESKSYKQAIVNENGIEFDHLVIAAGVWSNDLLKLIGKKVALQPGRGYSFDIQNEVSIAYPALLIDARVSVTPFANGMVRFGGGMELGYFDNKIFEKRLNEIFRSTKEYYPSLKNLNLRDIRIWQGHRPCSFDGLPYIGRVADSENVYLATGHSMMGITLAPATGKLIRELIEGKPPSIDPHPFRVNR